MMLKKYNFAFLYIKLSHGSKHGNNNNDCNIDKQDFLYQFSFFASLLALVEVSSPRKPNLPQKGKSNQERN